jgi:hypothetical protein
MLPNAILSIIDDYVDSMNEWDNLPSLCAVKRLIKHSDDYVLELLGFALGMPYIHGASFRLIFDHFSFFIQLHALPRIWLERKLKLAISQNKYTSRLIWIMVVKQPSLVNYSHFQILFSNSLYCRLMSYLMESQ